MKADVLVIGSGIAGMSYAIKMARKNPESTIILLSKDTLDQSNTARAQGGIAIVVDRDQDSIEQHIEDTIRVGDGMCDLEVVRMVVNKGPECLEQLMEWQVKLETEMSGELHLAKEGGHSASRVVHHKDQTGQELVRRLTQIVRQTDTISILENHQAIDLLIVNGSCSGVEVLNCRSLEAFRIYSKITVLATGGGGAIYGQSTNPDLATADGIAMGIRAGAVTENIEFVQFHPTFMYSESIKEGVLITEALRGFGARLINSISEHFMERYDPRMELAPRDVVTRSIVSEIQKTGAVFLDCRELDQIELANRFPGLVHHCRVNGLNPETDPLPVIPAAHYFCGGIKVDMDGCSTIERLYAIGEVSSTGLHGANRLASNSLLEAMVYADRAVSQSEKSLHDQINFDTRTVHITQKRKVDSGYVSDMTRMIGAIMQANAGVVRNEVHLKLAIRTMRDTHNQLKVLHDEFYPDRSFLELRNMAEVSLAILEASLSRTDNRGCFYKESD